MRTVKFLWLYKSAQGVVVIKLKLGETCEFSHRIICAGGNLFSYQNRLRGNVDEWWSYFVIITGLHLSHKSSRSGNPTELSEFIQSAHFVRYRNKSEPPTPSDIIHRVIITMCG